MYDYRRNIGERVSKVSVNQQGWECPKCGRVYSPFTPMCLHCSGNSSNRQSKSCDIEQEILLED